MTNLIQVAILGHEKRDTAYQLSVLCQGHADMGMPGAGVKSRFVDKLVHFGGVDLIIRPGV